MKAIVAAASGISILLGSLAAHGQTITTVEFSGVTKSANGIAIFIPPNGTPFSGSFSFDSSALDLNPSSQGGFYRFPDSVTSVFIEVGGLFQALSYTIGIEDNLPGSGTDSFHMSPVLIQEPGRASWGITFDDPTGTAISSDALVAPRFDLMRGLISLSCCANSGNYGFEGIINSVTVTQVSMIPEPATFTMLLTGLGIFGFEARRRKRPSATVA